MSGIQGFFAFSRSGKASYPFMAMLGTMSAGSTTTTGIYGGTTVAGMTLLSTQPASSAVKQVGLAVDGSFIAQASGKYSINGGSTWTTWSSDHAMSGAGRPFGVNGVIAYNPTAKRAASWFIYQSHVTNYIYIESVTSLGTYTLTSLAGMPPGQMPTNILYASAFNAFYAMQYGGGSGNWFSADGTTGLYANAGSLGGHGSHPPGISHNGRVMAAVFTGIFPNYGLREFTLADLSSSTLYGNISGLQYNAPAHSPFTYATINGKYIHAHGSGGSIIISSATTAAPHTYTQISTITPSGSSAISNSNFIEDSNGTLWVFGLYVQQLHAYFSAQYAYNYYSTDGGVTWTVKPGTQFAALAKNFNP